jgi:1-deoxy-D-xylulose-5-phosphate reductoisomerase
MLNCSGGRAFEDDRAGRNRVRSAAAFRSKPDSMKNFSILGSTGSIGRQCLDVVENHPGLFRVVGLAAGANVELLAEQTVKHRPAMVSAGTEQGSVELGRRLAAAGLNPMPEVLFGQEGMLDVATHPEAEMVVSAAVGVVGLPATYEAIRQGKDIALANKEVLVAAGELVMAEVKRTGVALLPVDSEHNAIHQCLRGSEGSEVKRLVLTASGGPFRRTPAKQLASVTPEQALAHPNWQMGRRITVDSATLMNKGFEVIEAHWLFDMPLERIDVVIHPQSTVHSMVEFVDGSVVAQLGPADMRMPIQYALTYPARVPSNGLGLDWTRLRKLEFAKVPARKFPCLRLARQALRKGHAFPCALNAADEVAVEAFLSGQLPFTGIAELIESVLSAFPNLSWKTMEDVVAADAEARRLAHEEMARRAETN